MRSIALILIILAGLALRVDHAWQGASENLPDSAAYERIARGISTEGEFRQVGPGTPAHPQSASNYSPGLPMLTGAVFTVIGDDDVRLVRMLLAVIGAAAIPIVFLIATGLTGGSRGDPGIAGLVAAAVVAFYPTLIGDAGLLLTEPLAGTLIAAGVLTILRARDGSRLLPWLVPGLMFGLATMVRPEYLIVTAAIALTLVLMEMRGGLRHALAPAGLLLLAFVVVIAPWTVRNVIAHDRVVPLSTGGGQTLFAGSYKSSGGNPTKVMPDLLNRNPDLLAQLRRQNRISGEGAESVTPERVFALLAAREYPDMNTDSALSKLGRDRYLDELRQNPLVLGGYFYRKTLRIWWRGRSDLMENPAGQAAHWAIVVVALAGLISLLWWRRPEFWILFSILLTATVIGSILVASPRRALVLWPLVSVLAGVGVAAAVALARSALQRRARPVAIA